MILSVQSHKRTVIHAMVSLSESELLAAISGGKLTEYAADVAEALLPFRREGAEQFGVSFVDNLGKEDISEDASFAVLNDALNKLRPAIERAEEQIARGIPG